MEESAQQRRLRLQALRETALGGGKPEETTVPPDVKVVSTVPATLHNPFTCVSSTGGSRATDASLDGGRSFNYYTEPLAAYRNQSQKVGQQASYFSAENGWADSQASGHSATAPSNLNGFDPEFSRIPSLPQPAAPSGYIPIPYIPPSFNSNPAYPAEQFKTQGSIRQEPRTGQGERIGAYRENQIASFADTRPTIAQGTSRGPKAPRLANGPACAKEQPSLFYNKSMVENPWRRLL